MSVRRAPRARGGYLTPRSAVSPSRRSHRRYRRRRALGKIKLDPARECRRLPVRENNTARLGKRDIIANGSGERRNRAENLAIGFVARVQKCGFTEETVAPAETQQAGGACGACAFQLSLQRFNGCVERRQVCGSSIVRLQFELSRRVLIGRRCERFEIRSGAPTQGLRDVRIAQKFMLLVAADKFGSGD